MSLARSSQEQVATVVSSSRARLAGAAAKPIAVAALLLFSVGCFSVGCGPDPKSAPQGMVWIPSGEFQMGSDSRLARPDEKPAHRVQLDGFWMDAAEVTNAEFRAFVEATGYLTDAERPPDLASIMAQVPPGTPEPPAEMLVAGSLVFTAPSAPGEPWWKWQPAASWRQPEGPGSDLSGREDHPVVQVSWRDAAEYAAWAGKRLPTEAEWEYAARGGLENAAYAWGSEADSEGSRMNTWQGDFPYQRREGDGYATTSPVRSFAPNGYGLYDVAGNVWEWVSDWYRPDTYARRSGRVVINPTGPPAGYDPDEPYAPKRVCRGGSFLCSENYCTGYRPSARMKTSPDTSLAHTGFRCAKSPDKAAQPG